MERIFLNDSWKFSESYSETMKEVEYDDGDMTSVRLPHTVKELPFTTVMRMIIRW